MGKFTYREAINQALLQEMERDPAIFIYGIDVSDYKRIFGTTKGLPEKFGEKRCFSTPLAEDALTGFGLGAAINGLRPILVHMRADFMLLAVNQLVNMVSSYRYSTGGILKVPFVIRAIIGKGWGQAFQHSKTMHSCFAHIPGLKVFMPSTPIDVKTALITAIRDDDPVIVFEHRLLYDVEGEIPDNPDIEDISRGKILEEGNALTLVATSLMNVEAVHAAKILRKRGIRIEVIDPIVLNPFDDSLILQSVKKTGYCLIADNDWVPCGFSAEIAARIAEKGYKFLKGPVKRVGFQFTPCPCTRPLEDLFYSNASVLIREIEALLGLSPSDLSGELFYTYENKFKGPF